MKKFCEKMKKKSLHLNSFGQKKKLHSFNVFFLSFILSNFFLSFFLSFFLMLVNLNPPTVTCHFSFKIVRAIFPILNENIWPVAQKLEDKWLTTHKTVRWKTTKPKHELWERERERERERAREKRGEYITIYTCIYHGWGSRFW